MQLKEDWHLILRHAWSVRFIVVAAVLSGFEVVVTLVPDLFHLPTPALAVLAFVSTSSALVARIVVQKNLTT